MKRTHLKYFLILSLFVGLVIGMVLWSGSGSQSPAELPIYTDGLQSDWQNLSWDTTVRLNQSGPADPDSTTLAARFTQSWGGLYLHQRSSIDVTDYDTLRFILHGGSAGGHILQVKLVDGDGTIIDSPATVTSKGYAWTQVQLPLADLLAGQKTISGIIWQDGLGTDQPVFYLDNVSLLGEVDRTVPTATPPAGGPVLSVDVSLDRHPIDPNIYGMNFADEALAAELRLPVNRWGGKAKTRYNWQLDATNRGIDWYFLNTPYENDNLSALPAGSASDKFIEKNQATGTKSIITVPLIGWTAKSRNRDCGFSAIQYPYQADFDGIWGCGNGVLPDSTPITGNNPLDTSIAISETFVADWVDHIVTRFGPPQSSGVHFYNLDNEPMMWHHSQRDVHPEPLSYDQLRDLTYRYAAAIKAVDPEAKILGPVVWGWTAYFYSALDQASAEWWNNPLDRRAHGDIPLVEWYLQQMQQYERDTGTRLLDYLDLHYYPQADGVALSSAGDEDTQARRLRSTRSLWDPTYVDESWIDEPVYLIPRMRNWVDTHYPGTKLAITEYNWGALDHINGALAQADVLGIFGREGVDLAALWESPQVDEPGAFAFRMYRNYDGNGSMFGNRSIAAESSDPAALAIYAAQRERDDVLTVIVINKSGQNLTSRLSLSSYAPTAQAAVYRYSAENLNQIERLTDQPVAADFTAKFPAYSITLFEISSQLE